MKFLDRVTITGADDSNSPLDLSSLTFTYPFVEWGILVSKSSFGKGSHRFPSEKWLGEFFSVCRRERESPHIPSQSLALSLHICGKWVRDICKGNWTIVNDIPNFAWDLFSRIQLNFSPYISQIDPFEFGKSIPDVIKGKELIFQVNPDTFDDMKILTILTMIARASWPPAQVRPLNTPTSVLYDGSGGKGEEPKVWMHPLKRFLGTDGGLDSPPKYVGFAGGLDPLKLEEQLSEIALVAGCGPCWIDTESRVRVQNKLDVDLVATFLRSSKRALRDEVYR